MKKLIAVEESIVSQMVKGFSQSTVDTIRDIAHEYDLSKTGNFKNMGSWDVRFSRVSRVGLQNGYLALVKKRGVWNFLVLLNEATGTLYVFSKEKNIELVKKNFGKDKIHYFHALLTINGEFIELTNGEMNLFEDYYAEYDEKRLIEARKVLSEDFSSVKQVVFVVGKEVDKEIAEVEARLYNKYFELVDVMDWSNYIDKVEYADADSYSYSEDEEHQVNELLVKVKQEVKDKSSKNKGKEQIPQKKILPIWKRKI